MTSKALQETKSGQQAPTDQSKSSFKNLVQLGTHGHFPIFCKDWLIESDRKLLAGEKQLAPREKHSVNTIIEGLNRQRCVERKRTLLMGLSKKERELFVRAFMKMVEDKILDERPLIQ